MVFVKGEKRALATLPRVLVVDDEADIRELVDLTLSRMGLAADCAGTVAEAIGLLKANRYVLCLTDMRLPDGEGAGDCSICGSRVSADAGGGHHGIWQCR